MKFRWFLVFLFLAAFGAGAWALFREPEMAVLPSTALAPGASVSARAPSAASSKLSASAVLSIDPRAPGARSGQNGAAGLYGEYLKAKQLKSLYDRLKSSPEGQTPEGEYLLYEIMRRCANVSDRSAPRPFTRPTPKRDEFVASLSPSDPQRDKRIAAYDQVETNRCAGFDGVTVTQSDLNKLLAASVNGGDPKARAVSVEQEIWQQRRAGGRFDNMTLSDAQIDTLHQALATRDPGAMVIAGRILSNTWHDLSIQIGPDGEAAEPRALNNAWQILACDYGYPCDSSNTRVLQECALQGHCQATSLQDYLYYYNSSPHDSQLAQQYEGILRNAVETGDWSQVSVVRGPRPPGPRMWFTGPGR